MQAKANEFKKQYNEAQLLNIIWSLSLTYESIFSYIYKQADFLKSPNAKRLSRQTLSNYLHGLRDKGLIKKVQNKWLLTKKGYKTLAESQKPRPFEPVYIIAPLEEGSITLQEAIELNLINFYPNNPREQYQGA